MGGKWVGLPHVRFGPIADISSFDNFTSFDNFVGALLEL